MMSHSFDRQLLLKLSRNKPASHESFWQTERPVLWLAAHDLVKHPDSYYREVAKLYHMTFITEIPVRINDAQSLANVIGPEKLSMLDCFIYRDDTRVVIACADPFVLDKATLLCREAVGDKQPFEAVMAPLSAVREAMAQSFYTTSTTRAETSLHFALPEYSSRGLVTSRFRIGLFIAMVVFLAVLFFNPPAGFLLFFVLINAAYLVLNPFRLLIFLGAFWFKPVIVTATRLKTIADSQLPPYTILVPAKQEASVVPQLIAGLKAIDYPPEQLDIKLIVEVTDHETINAYAKMSIDQTNQADFLHTAFHLVKVPTGKLSTKPRSCNYALQFARGQLTVIYDAEDKPDPRQLKKAYLTLLDEPLNTLCVQGKLNFYNADQNLLTRFFALEYGFWYDFMLPGLEAWHIPLPLGGTSNHFITGTLRKIGTWDPYNVTEDADIGWRLSQLGYRTTMLDSYTLEEANSQTWNWITQRTRWQKGFLLTTMVHLRHPIRMWRQLGMYGFLSSATVFMTNFLLPLVNPILWGFFICWYVPPLFGLTPVGFTLPDWLHMLGAINLLFGNGLFMLVYLIAAIGRRQWSQLPLIPLMPLYWLLISVASYRSVWQILISPYKWEKTKHGLEG